VLTSRVVPTRVLVVDDSPTIRRVVSTILERHGYEAAQASDGQDAYDVLASGEVKADIVLLDFVMPRMNGYQFCRALREHAELSSTPVVLMSAKADRIRDQFVHQTGALDAITKPFDAQALVLVVENALRRATTGRGSSARLPLENEPIASVETPQATEFETLRTHVAQIVATKLASVVTKVIAERPAIPSGDLAVALTEQLQKEAIVEMIEAVRDMQPEDGGPVLAGDLGVIPIGAVLQLLQSENQSGVLTCRSEGTRVVATFRGGLIDLVQSSGASDEFRLGRFFVEEGILKPTDIDEAIEKSRGMEGAPASRVLVRDNPSSPDTVKEDPQARSTFPGPSRPPIPADEASGPEISLRELRGIRPRLLGTVLLDAGKIDATQLKSALVRQSSELLYEVLRWTRGRFELRRSASSEAVESAKLGLPVATVVMEGFRRVDEWRVLERTLGSFDIVLIRDDDVLASVAKELTEKETKVLDLVDGERTVRAIVAASHMSSFDACRILVQFLEARALRKRS
jgi:DNA-binding response OmpR family regulator